MFQVLHSSAGAGKTHALVKHYLELCFTGGALESYRGVLALTFTNKAAAEMKERVLRYLEGLAEGGPWNGALGDVAGHLQALTGLEAGALAQRARAIQRHMLHHWNDVAISTIDAFTQRVVRPFARDLRLEEQLAMTTEQGYYLDLAVVAVIHAAGTDARTAAVLSRACRQLLSEERAWDPARPLTELSQELLKERSIGPLKKLRTLTVDEVSALSERIHAANAAFKRQVRSIGEEALDLLAQRDIAKSELAYGGAIQTYFERMARFEDLWEEPGTNTRKPVETGKWAAAKADAAAISAINTVAPALTDLFKRAEDLRANGHRDHLVRRAVARELWPAFTLHQLDEELERLKRADRVAFFSDLTRRVVEVVKEAPVPFIYERLGERYNHFLIDEFQDTSLLQWNALLPLVENALAEGGTALVVGDAKQAIYRWRNGEVRLFVELPRIHGRDPDDEHATQREATLVRTHSPAERLEMNRRSAPAIVAFNNDLFGELLQLLPADLARVYAQHDQKAARDVLGGVHLALSDPGVRGEALLEAQLRFTLQAVEAALRDGYAPQDVAVLVRSARLGQLVARHLMQAGHLVNSPDGAQIAADPRANLLVELLRFTYYPDPVTALRVLQWQARTSAIVTDGTERTAHAMDLGGRHAPDDAVTRVAAHLREHGDPRLRTTITAMLMELAEAFDLVPASDAALLVLLDEAHRWSTLNGQDIGGFLHHWERTGAKRTTSAGDQANAVQVMTIHKAKGLEFPVVIVPDVRMNAGPKQGGFLWVDPGTAVPELPTALVRTGKVIGQADLPELTEEDALRLLDDMNLLYVAFTRAERRLHAFIPTATDVLTKALTTHVEGRPDLLHEAEPSTGPGTHTPIQVSSHVLRSVRQPGLPRAVSLAMEQDPTAEDPASDRSRAFGTSVHGVLAATRTVDGLAAVLSQALERGELATDEVPALQVRLQQAIRSEQLAPWFDAARDVRPEAVLIDAQGRTHRPDRVLIDATGVHVLEIKTGKPDPSHERQLRSYLQLFRTMGHPMVDGLLWYPLTDTFEMVHP